MDSSHGALAERMGIEVTTATPELVVATMPVAGNTQFSGVLHGGASAALAETAGGIGANLHAGALGMIALGVALTMHHHKAVPDDGRSRVTARAQPLRLGRRIADYRIEITDDDGALVSSGMLACALVPATQPSAR